MKPIFSTSSFVIFAFVTLYGCGSTENQSTTASTSAKAKQYSAGNHKLTSCNLIMPKLGDYTATIKKQMELKGYKVSVNEEVYLRSVTSYLGGSTAKVEPLKGSMLFDKAAGIGTAYIWVKSFQVATLGSTSELAFGVLNVDSTDSKESKSSNLFLSKKFTWSAIDKSDLYTVKSFPKCETK